ncbi:response regulator transcription factor [Undibacterium sp.]|jgi:two-component system nitrate/nitrite response regulator NarL|uniref:response regulator transcription factor n=1 Tax=Undibacterium sp. TaxID=1914977 RepID=UPI002D0611F0|nr:response regulator transcription factor [Undibacterium sp.]HTD02997.1 response regulator transcription factor [Undibacterium sp.]
MSQQANIRIFLVDDHPLVRDGLKARLETISHFAIVGEAGNAEEALRKAADTPIDLVLMDINLNGHNGMNNISGSNGIALTARFAADYPGVNVIMLSMHDKAEYVTQAMQAGARGYVLKDAPAEHIIAAIESVMSGKTYLSAGLQQPSNTSSSAAALTQREQDILKSIATGKSNKHIAQELGLSVRTVETHRLNIKRKLNIEGQADLIRFALSRSML